MLDINFISNPAKHVDSRWRYHFNAVQRWRSTSYCSAA